MALRNLGCYSVKVLRQYVILGDVISFLNFQTIHILFWSLCCMSKLTRFFSLCSDEAVAAFVETSGGSLVELSLNNVKKVSVSLSPLSHHAQQSIESSCLSRNNTSVLCFQVGHNTALALAKFSEKLQILDVSWCRDMSDNALGYIVDSCSSLKVLKVFGCTQVNKYKNIKIPPSSS